MDLTKLANFANLAKVQVAKCMLSKTA